jgi:dTDP-glucose 4,6-dehydratase
VDGIWKLMQSDCAEPVNIGNPHEMTIREFADAIARHTGTETGVVPRPLPKDDPQVRQPDITKAREILGWEPKVGFDEGIKATIAYFNEHLKEGAGQ